MYELTFINEYGKSITLTEKDNIDITLLDGFYSSSATINTTKVGTKAGERLASKTVDKRDLGVYFEINKDVSQERNELYDVFRTGVKIKVLYKNSIRDVSIDAIVQNITILPHEQRTTGSIMLVCPAPYFNDINEIIDTVSLVIGSFTFPFEIESSGIPFSYLDTISEMNVTNSGNVVSGMKIRITALYGDVINPIVYNRETTEFIGLGSESNPFTLEAGDIVVIDTENKKAAKISDSITSNVFNYLISGITWLTLTPGDNVFTFESDTGTTNMGIEFIHQDQYEGV